MQRNSAGRFVGARGESSQSAQPTGRPEYRQARGESNCTSSATSSILSLLAGAAVGTIAMYLLDPEEGADRRASTKEAAARALEASSGAARSAYDTTKDALSSAWDTVSHKAGDVGSAAYAALPSGKDVRKSGQRFFQGARDAASDIGSRVSDAGSSVSDTAGSWMSSARGMLPRKFQLEKHSDYAMNPTGISITAISALALGAGAMWLLDTRRGAGRRAWLGQKTNRFLNEIGSFSRATGRHLSNKTKGYYHETASAVSSAGASLNDSTIVQRVRDAFASLGDKVSAIGVSCANGCVTLTGRCRGEHVDEVVKSARETQGVNDVTNQLEAAEI